jgi:2-oxo-4-hydroxy-4-carboxy-5-ureidoimidazoline decarboxylase
MRWQGLPNGPRTGDSVGMGTDRLTWFNELPVGAAQQALLDCCSAPGWAAQMAAARPFPSARDAIRQSGAIVAALTVPDLTSALAGHPRIGERADASGGTPSGARYSRAGESNEASMRPQAAGWSAQEQSGVDGEDAGTRQALAEANQRYEQRFGHIYLVCAAGRTGAELLSVLHDRLQNEPEDEWQVVRAELQKINALRLQQILTGPA